MNESQTERVLADPSVHYWVKDLIRKVQSKDPVDVLNGLDLVKSLIEN